MIYIEKSAQRLPLAERAAKNNLVEIVEDGFTPEDDKKNILITSSENSFVHRCPATKIYRCCNYYVTDAVEGCPFDCSYCILQSYLNHSWIKVYGNLDKIEGEIRALGAKGERVRLGTGELADSLALDNILGLSEFFVPIVNQYDNIQFELKTKSVNIQRLFNLDPKNIVISWSLNPQRVIEAEEHGAAPLAARLKAAKEISEYGYKVSFHFDPVICYEGFEKDYDDLMEQLADSVAEASVEFISVSTFRFMPELLGVVRAKFPGSLLLKRGYTEGLDGKMRYFKPLRAHMLRSVVGSIRKRWGKAFVYFCMEHSSLWEKLIGFDPGEREELESLFPFVRQK
jgi:spore photoproduct lyase